MSYLSREKSSTPAASSRLKTAAQPTCFDLAVELHLPSATYFPGRSMEVLAYRYGVGTDL